MRFLEQQNKALETKWSLLQEQDSGPNTDNCKPEPFFENYISSLRAFLDGLHVEKDKLHEELRSVEETVEDFKKRCGGFPGGAVVESLPANAGDTGSSPGLGRSHMPRSN